MVLIKYLIFIFAGTGAAVAALASPAFDDTALRDANRLVEDKKYLEANLKITGAYDLRSRELPLPVLVTECGILMNLERWQEASAFIESSLRDRLPWAKSYMRTLKSTPPPPEPASLNNDELGLLNCAAEYKAQTLQRDYKKLSLNERRTLKIEASNLHAFLAKSAYNGDKVERIAAALKDQDDMVLHQKFERRFQILLSYLTWEETSEFYVSRSVYKGHSVTLVPCLGGAVASSSYFYDYSAGSCYGLGKAHSQVDGKSFDSGANVEAFNGFIKALRKFSEGRAAMGLQAGLLNRGITGHISTGESAKASHLDLTLVGVARLSFTRTFFDLKGGVLFGQTGTLWSLEFGYTL